MSHFRLPTSVSKPSSGSQGMRYDAIVPTSALPNRGNGGGSVTFQVDTPANNWFVPSMSYFDFRIIVSETLSSATTGIDKTDGYATSISTAHDTVQFAEYPASHIVTNYAHSIAGVSLENISDCAEASAIQMRTMLNKEIVNTLGSSFRINDDRTGVNDADSPPSGSLQPWNGTLTTFSCAYQPPGSLFDYDGGLPGMKQRIVLSLESTLKKCLLSKSTTNTNVYNIAIDSITFYAAHVIPSFDIAIPPVVTLSLEMRGVTKQSHNGSASTHTFSVPPSTDRVYVFKNKQEATGAIGTAAHEFDQDITDLEMAYAGQRAPALAYSSMVSTTGPDTLRAFWDFTMSTGHVLRSNGLQDNEMQWALRPVYAGIFDKPEGDASTTLTVRSKGSTAGNIGVCHVSHKVAVLTYDEAGICTGLVVQENLM